MPDGFIKLSRSLLAWDWHDEPKTGYLYIVMLLLANHEETLWRGETLRRGQLLTGRRQLSIASGLTEDEVRTALMHLKKTGDAVVSSKNKYSIITLPKYDEHCTVTRQIPGESPGESPAESQTESPANPQQVPSTSTADPHIQELKELKELEKGVLRAPAPACGEDGDDALMAQIASVQRASALIRRYGLTDSDATLESLLQDAERVGFDALEEALHRASVSDNRGGVSVNYYRAILRDGGQRKEENDPYAGVPIYGG